jgi:leucine-rich PPR motif-containing protein
MRDVEPNETTYHLLLACVCEVGDIEQATEIVSVMKAKGFPASESVFTALVLGHARAG